MAFLMPSRIGSPWPETTFSLAQLSYRLNLGDGLAYATGNLYTADGLPLATLAERLPLSRPTALHLSAVMAPALVLATYFLPARYSQNTVTLETSGDCREELVIEGRIPDDTRNLMLQGTKQLANALRRLGAFAIPGSRSIPLSGSDAHLAGTLPMKEHGDDLTCTPDCELRPWRNLFVVDGSCLPDLPAKHCTFTIMANADRVGRVVVNRLAGSGPAF